MNKTISMSSLYNCYSDTATYLFNNVASSSMKEVFMVRMELGRHNNTIEMENIESAELHPNITMLKYMQNKSIPHTVKFFEQLTTHFVPNHNIKNIDLRGRGNRLNGNGLDTGGNIDETDDKESNFMTRMIKDRLKNDYAAMRQ